MKFLILSHQKNSRKSVEDGSGDANGLLDDLNPTLTNQRPHFLILEEK